jgi:DNA-binding transcriptional LysR family regulator
MLDLHLLRQFVAVAEREHIGRAADALHMSQSPLSRQIMQLEGRLGFSLFEREKKRIRLTHQGRGFLQEARALLAHAEGVEARAQRIASGEAGMLTIGYVDGAVHIGVLPRALLRFAAQRPDVRIELRALRTLQQLEALQRDEIECGFVYSPPDKGHPTLRAHLISKEPMMLALPAEHPLAKKASLQASELNGLPWITRPPESNRRAHLQFLEACAAAGFVPDVRFEASDPATSLGLVAAGLGLALVQKSMSSTLVPSGVILREAPWYRLAIKIYVVWRFHNENTLLTALISSLRERKLGARAQ